ncbi:PQQ-binding-like beta-propeller repeat protein [Halobacterium bonnevillei]|uniref:PQQ-binding-like beta-propeller repeat protein n=1 Tax=Halobacterium bonnevillei TaxID=2692200 RepID=A0A6B0SVS4_9EURY|nr:PQQ-binding-like beta-propeller repeat protein [Halobacterium bonnevillei]
MPSRRFSRRALLATVGSAIAATAGCNAPAESSETSPSNTTADAPDSTDEGTDSGASDDREISLSGEDAWTTYGYEAGHSGYNPDAVGPADDPGMVWNSSVEGIYTLREPAVADGRVFVGSDQIMWAFDAMSGDSEWQRNLGGMAHHFSPTYRDDTLYVVAKDASGVNSEAAGSVRALNPETGDRRWASSLPVTSTVAHDGDRLYVAAKADGNGYVQTLDPDSGDRGWRFDVPDASESYVTAVPTYADGTVYVAATKVDGDGSTPARCTPSTRSPGTWTGRSTPSRRCPSRPSSPTTASTSPRATARCTGSRWTATRSGRRTSAPVCTRGRRTRTAACSS